MSRIFRRVRLCPHNYLFARSFCFERHELHVQFQPRSRREVNEFSLANAFLPLTKSNSGYVQEQVLIGRNQQGMG